MNQSDKYYIGDQSFEFKNDNADKIQQRIKNLLLLSNVNVLTGNGVSLSLGTLASASQHSTFAIHTKPSHKPKTAKELSCPPPKEPPKKTFSNLSSNISL
jgi:hypothetical protein